jgi:hypothetical protein
VLSAETFKARLTQLGLGLAVKARARVRLQSAVGDAFVALFVRPQIARARTCLRLPFRAAPLLQVGRPMAEQMAIERALSADALHHAAVLLACPPNPSAAAPGGSGAVDVGRFAAAARAVAIGSPAAAARAVANAANASPPPSTSPSSSTPGRIGPRSSSSSSSPIGGAHERGDSSPWSAHEHQDASAGLRTPTSARAAHASAVGAAASVALAATSGGSSSSSSGGYWASVEAAAEQRLQDVCQRHGDKVAKLRAALGLDALAAAESSAGADRTSASLHDPSQVGVFFLKRKKMLIYLFSL